MTSDKLSNIRNLKFLEELASMMETSSRANWGNDIDWQQELKWFRNEILEHLRRNK